MDTNILFKTMHVIDLDNSKVNANTNIPEDFESYIKELLNFVLANENTRSYKVHDEYTQVIHCINQITVSCNKGKSVQKELFDLAFSVADKLFRVEEQVQEVIGRTGQNVKRGSLLQALLHTEENQYYYVMAKVEHQEWYDGSSLIKGVGFPEDEKKAWKTAVVPMTIDEDDMLEFGVLKVHTDNAAKYWARDFMEIEELLSDGLNTRIVFAEIDNVLKRKVKKTSPSDYLILRGALIQTLKTDREIAYYDMVNEMIDGYQAESNELKLDQLKSILVKLPEQKNFDTNFHTVPSAINARSTRTKYKPTSGIELSVDESIGNPRETIIARHDSERGNLLEIPCTDPEVFKTFNFKKQL